MSAQAIADRGFWSKCGSCGHCWIAAFFPMDLKKFSEVVIANSRRCPKCGANNTVVAKQDNGELLEPQP